MLTFEHATDDEEDEDTADAGVTDPTTRLFQMVKDRDYDDEEEEIVDDEDDGLMPLSEEPDEMKRVSTYQQDKHCFAKAIMHIGKTHSFGTSVSVQASLFF